MRYREPAICLRTTDFSETSQVVHFLTRAAGVVRLLAKGAERPKSSSGGMIDLLAEGELVFTSSDRQTLGTLIEFSESVSHSALRRDAGRLNIAMYMIEAVGEMLAEADPHAEVFDLLHNSLLRLAQADAPLQAVLAYFQWRLLRHAGLLGDLTTCVSCNRPVVAGDDKSRLVNRELQFEPQQSQQDAGTTQSAIRNPQSAIGDSAIRNQESSGKVYFTSTHGGLLCPACEGAAAEKYRLDEDTLAGIAVLLAVEGGAKGLALPDKQARHVNRLLCYHISHQLGKPLKMAKHAII